MRILSLTGGDREPASPPLAMLVTQQAKTRLPHATQSPKPSRPRPETHRGGPATRTSPRRCSSRDIAHGGCSRWGLFSRSRARALAGPPHLLRAGRVTFLARAMGCPTPRSLARRSLWDLVARGTCAVRSEPAPYHVMNLVLHLDDRGRWSPRSAAVSVSGQRFRGCSLALRVTADRIYAHPLGFGHSRDPGHAAFPHRLLALAVGREGDSTPLLWAGALTGVAAALSKEKRCSPAGGAFIAANIGNTRARPWRVIVPQAALMFVFVLAFVATLRSGSTSGAKRIRSTLAGFPDRELSHLPALVRKPDVPMPDSHSIAKPLMPSRSER